MCIRDSFAHRSLRTLYSLLAVSLSTFLKVSFPYFVEKQGKAAISYTERVSPTLISFFKPEILINSLAYEMLTHVRIMGLFFLPLPLFSETLHHFKSIRSDRIHTSQHSSSLLLLVSRPAWSPPYDITFVPPTLLKACLLYTSRCV